MAVNGFTWNVGPAGAELLALVLKRVADGRAPTGVDQHMAQLYFDSLDRFLRSVPDGYSPTPIRTYRTEEEGLG
jgi:hypothetical protein